MKTKKVLFVLSSQATMGDNGEPTGWWLSEASHPWKILHEGGYEVDFVSPKGGKAPMTGTDNMDVVDENFLADPNVKEKLDHTLTPDAVISESYDAIHFVGGHGAMWDFPDNNELIDLCLNFWNNGKIISAICHGVAGLLNLRLDNGAYLIAGKNITSFTDQEEKAIQKCQEVPYFLQCQLMLRGAVYHITEAWSDHVIRDGRILTGQNPQSGLTLGKELLKMLNALKSED